MKWSMQEGQTKLIRTIGQYVSTRWDYLACTALRAPSRCFFASFPPFSASQAAYECGNPIRSRDSHGFQQPRYVRSTLRYWFHYLRSFSVPREPPYRRIRRLSFSYAPHACADLSAVIWAHSSRVQESECCVDELTLPFLWPGARFLRVWLRYCQQKDKVTRVTRAT